MGKTKTYKWQAGDEVGLYRVIKVLPSKPHVKNIVIYAECLLCHEKVERFSNRMESKHRGCEVKAVIDKEAEPVVVVPKPHIRANGQLADEAEAVGELIAESQQTDRDAEDFLPLSTIDLPPEVAEALSVNIDDEIVKIVEVAKELDRTTYFIFVNTLRRYLQLLHLTRQLEYKINKSGELTVLGSSGTQVANPLIVQYKQISSESNQVIKQLLGIVGKMNAGKGEADPLLEALARAGAE